MSMHALSRLWLAMVQLLLWALRMQGCSSMSRLCAMGAVWGLCRGLRGRLKPSWPGLHCIAVQLSPQ